MKVFVSHHNSDARKLGKVKLFLKGHGFQLFLAQEDIAATEGDSPAKIKREIRESEVFLLIANQKSKKSLFCNQEIGFALDEEGYKKIKILVAYSDNEYLPQEWGLLATHQGFSHDDWDDLSEKTLKELEKLRTGESLVSFTDNQSYFDLRIMNLLGSWDEFSQQDKSIVKKLLDKDFSVWIEIIRGLINESQSPIKLEDSKIWKVKEEARFALWKTIGDSIFNEHLDKFKECAIEVLSELHPKFEMPSGKRYTADFYGKIPSHSKHLRKGIAETLALLGNKPESLKHCELNETEVIPRIVVKKVLQNADWVLWASLNDVLPLLAEAAPNEFIDKIEKILEETPCTFDDLFSQEETGIFVANYMSGLLWALEGLAWKQEYISRVTVVLGKLALRDPRGSWGNRPDTSLFTIFLPMFPQTIASWEKQRVSIATLRKENSEVAWKLLLSLLPRSHKSSSGFHKPWSYTVPEFDPNEIIRSKEYKKQVLFYQETVVEMAMENDDNLIELVGQLDRLLDRLYPDHLTKLIEHIESHEMPQEKKTVLWEKLIDSISTYKRFFAKQNGALPTEYVEQIEKIIDKIAPNDLQNLHSCLFNKEYYDLYEKGENYEERAKEFESRRQNAIKGIFHEGGIDSIIEFAKKVKVPYRVGFSLGSFIDNKEDFLILKRYLQVEPDSIAKFIAGFIRAKHGKVGWKWVDKLNTKEWTETQKRIFLKYLPFRKETWKRAEKWLKDGREYWKEAIFKAHYLKKKEFEISVTKLLECDRPISAIDCLYWMNYYKLQLPPEESIRALIMAVSTKEKSPVGLIPYNIAQIIKNLQNNPKVNRDDLIKVEIAYLNILDQESEYSPKTLGQKIASEPDFFYNILSNILSQLYKSKNDTEEQKKIAIDSFYILKAWKTIPGTQTDGTFSPDKFISWIEKALKLCSESGGLEFGQESIGKVLINSPKDPDGLWIHRTVAETLNKINAEEMRQGFSTALFNSRGAYIVDPTGKSEKALAEKYKKMAEDVENEGFERLGATIRQLAKRTPNGI